MSLTIKAGWIIATSICVGYIAPIFPFTGFSFPFDAMQSWVVTLSQLFPLTHYVQFQAEQWILATPFLTSLLTLGKLAIFGVVFALIGIPLMSRQMKKAIEEETML